VEAAGKLALMVLEKHKVYGTELPPGLEKLKSLRKPAINKGQEEDDEDESEF